MRLTGERTRPDRLGDVVDAATWRAWWQAAARAVTREAAALDALNVFPVPDRDTGKNLRATVLAAWAALEAAAGRSLPESVRALARGALDGARGNSGTILSQWIRGVAEALAAGTGPEALAAAFRRGAETARCHVAEPAEGTMLTVMDAAARAAAGNTVEQVLTRALAAAETALAETPAQLPVLARAGVVDAGALGWVVILRAWTAVLRGEGGDDPVEAASAPEPDPVVEPAPDDPAVWAHPYEIQAVLEAGPEVAAVKAAGGAWGDSLVVGQDLDGRIRVHVHTARPLTVVAALAALGPIRRLEWTDMRPNVPRTLDVVAPAPWRPLLTALGLPSLDPDPAHDRPGVVWVAPDRPPAAALAVGGIGAAIRAALAYDPHEPWEAARTRLERDLADWRDLVVAKEARGYRASGHGRLTLEALGELVDDWLGAGGNVTALLGPEVTPEEARWWEAKLAAGDVQKVPESPAWVVLVRE